MCNVDQQPTICIVQLAQFRDCLGTEKIQQEQQWKRLNNSLQFGWVSCYSFNGDGIYLEMQSSVKHCSAHIPPFLKHFNSPFEVTAKSLKRSSATRSDSSGKMCSNYGLNYTQQNILDDPRQTAEPVHLWVRESTCQAVVCLVEASSGVMNKFE